MRNQKGITLVALVITIIVLLILAGVSISLVVGENGVLNRAQDAVKDQKAAEIREAISLAVNSCDAYWGSQWADNTSYTRKDAYDDANNGLVKEMEKQGYTLGAHDYATSTTDFKDWKVTISGTTYTVQVALTETGRLDFGTVTQDN